MKVIRIIAALLLCWLAPHESVAQSPAQAGLLDFIATQRDRHFDDVPHEVLAFYYTWYGRPERQDHWVHWGGENTTNHSTPQTMHYPARGAYGDGMAYVEHRTPPLQGGRTIYVWMRMSDVVGEGRLLGDILMFAAANMKPFPGQK